MKKLLLIITTILLILSNCENSSNNPHGDNNEKYIIPLAIGNTWNYSFTKEDIEVYKFERIITEIKTFPVILPDSSEITRNIYICRAILKDSNNVMDTTFGGFIKDIDGIIFVQLNENHSKGIYNFKLLNDLKIDWIDTLQAWYKCIGTDTMTIPAGTFNCIKYQYKNKQSFMYLSKGIGIVAETHDDDFKAFLVSYSLK
ncbi:MAG: hypothetical protein V1779_00105 [bacterium]